MKYIIILGDGMADHPIEALQNKTPLEAADTPNMDKLSRTGEIGMVQTIPSGMNPGSDTANLSVLGYDPGLYYSGRAPLEALSIGVPMEETDIAMRCNLVSLSENGRFEDLTMVDHSSSEISTEDASVLLKAVAEELQNDEFQFYVGTSYRHCLIWKKGRILELTPPHDILERKIGEYLPIEEKLLQMLKKSYKILKDHPMNLARKEKGLHPANCCWFWGAGTRPALTSFFEKTGKRGAMISAVDLLKGIAVGAGMKVISVKGANGGLHTNYKGKAEAAIQALTEDQKDFVYVHLEAPDEMGHQGSAERKVESIHRLDVDIIGPIVQGLQEKKVDFRMLILPDHPTPVCVRTHTSDEVPYLLYDSTTQRENESFKMYSEKTGMESQRLVKKGYELIDRLFSK